MRVIKLFCLIFFIFFIVLFLFGCSVEASSNDTSSIEKCNISTSSGDVYRDVNKNTIYFDRNDYLLNFKNKDNKSISTNSFTTSCEGDTF